MLYEHFNSVGDHHLRIPQAKANNFNFQLHLQKSFELVVVEEGEMMVQISGKDFSVTGGKCALILPGQPHAYRTPQHSVSWICIFSIDYLPDLYRYCSSGKIHDPVFPLRGDELYQELRDSSENRFRLKSLLYDVAAEYVAGERREDMHIENNDLICNIVQFIESHYTEPLTLHRVAAEFGYNYRYMSMLMSRYFQTSLSQVVNQYRISYACALLREGNYSITDVSERCGFDSQRNFNRNFKAITSMTPPEFLRKNV